MPTKNQHFVPRVYIKAWETEVENFKEPTKKFEGVYIFKKGSNLGEGHTKESVLWKPHLYTISFRQLYMATKCPRVYSYFVDEVEKTMKSNSPSPVYGKYGYSIIKTKQSIRKHLLNLEDWKFYYEDGSIAKTQGIINRINDFRCYILEDSFGTLFEAKWGDILNEFIQEVHYRKPVDIGQCESIIKENVAKDMMKCFFIMLCRSPQFDAMGVYPWMSDILKLALSSAEIDEMMGAVWFTELYRIFYKNTGGFYHTALDRAIDECKLTLFEAYSDAELFITSDNPAFHNYSAVTVRNWTGYFFPLSPKYLLFVGKGKNAINVIDHRFADIGTVKYFNQIIKQNSCDMVIGTKKNLGELI